MAMRDSCISSGDGGCVVREAVGWLLFVVGVLAFLAVYVALWHLTGMAGWW